MNIGRLEKVEIDGQFYVAIVAENGAYIHVYNFISAEDFDMLGRFILEEDKLIEYYPMTDRKVVIGRIISF